jgi:hypothetical protein
MLNLVVGIVTTVFKGFLKDHVYESVRKRDSHNKLCLKISYNKTRCRYQWQRTLRRRSAAARLLRLWVRIPPSGMDVYLLRVLCFVR